MGLTAKFSHPENGSYFDNDRCKKLLIPDKEYTVSRVSMGLALADIYLEGFNIPFNSAQFDFFEDGEKIDIYKDARYNPWLRNKTKHLEAK